MMNGVTQAPVALLLSPDLPASAKLIWMVASLRPPAAGAGTAWLAATAGVSRPTVLKGAGPVGGRRLGSDPGRGTGPCASHSCRPGPCRSADPRQGHPGTALAEWITGFLVNPRTDERLQLDRFYPPRVAFEFHGPQRD